MPSSHFTKTWLLVTVPVSGLSTYVPPPPSIYHSLRLLTRISWCRSFAWLRSRRPRMSADRTSSSSVYQISNSLSPIGWPSRSQPSSPTAPALSRCALFSLGRSVYGQCRMSQKQIYVVLMVCKVTIRRPAQDLLRLMNLSLLEGQRT